MRKVHKFMKWTSVHMLHICSWSILLAVSYCTTLTYQHHLIWTQIVVLSDFTNSYDGENSWTKTDEMRSVSDMKQKCHRTVTNDCDWVPCHKTEVANERCHGLSSWACDREVESVSIRSVSDAGFCRFLWDVLLVVEILERHWKDYAKGLFLTPFYFRVMTRR